MGAGKCHGINRDTIFAHKIQGQMRVQDLKDKCKNIIGMIVVCVPGEAGGSPPLGRQWKQEETGGF